MRPARALALALLISAASGVASCGEDIEAECNEACDRIQSDCDGTKCIEDCHEAVEQGCGEEYTEALTCTADAACDEGRCGNETTAFFKCASASPKD